MDRVNECHPARSGVVAYEPETESLARAVIEYGLMVALGALVVAAGYLWSDGAGSRELRSSGLQVDAHQRADGRL